MKISALKKYSSLVILLVERERVMKRVKAAHFASLIIDGATDASIMEQGHSLRADVSCGRDRRRLYRLGDDTQVR